MKRISGKLTYANVVASLALFVALGGGAYAATQLPKNSVGPKQLKKEAVTPAKLSKASRSALAGAEGARGPVGARGPAGLKGDKGERGEPGPAGNLSTNLPRDVTLRGRFDDDAVATATLQEHGEGISFGDSLAAAPQFQIVAGAGTPECPGSVADPRAGPGYLCLYVAHEANIELVSVEPFEFGAELVIISHAAGRYRLAGSWAVSGS